MNELSADLRDALIELGWTTVDAIDFADDITPWIEDRIKAQLVAAEAREWGYRDALLNVETLLVNYKHYHPELADSALVLDLHVRKALSQAAAERGRIYDKLLDIADALGHAKHPPVGHVERAKEIVREMLTESAAALRAPGDETK